MSIFQWKVFEASFGYETRYFQKRQFYENIFLGMVWQLTPEMTQNKKKNSEDNIFWGYPLNLQYFKINLKNFKIVAYVEPPM